MPSTDRTGPSRRTGNRAGSRAGNRDRVFAFVRERLLSGQPPTVREVQRHLGFKAVESARAHLTALVADGRLEKTPGAARGYRLPGRPDRDSTARLVPLLGRVPAGDPLLAVEEVEGYLPALGRSSWRLAGKGLFALRVRGHSMRGAGILDGDVVIVRQQSTADSGDIVVALVGDEATVKRLHIEGHNRDDSSAKGPTVSSPTVSDPTVGDLTVGDPTVGDPTVRLLPENPDFDPIVPDPDEFSLLGRVIEVRRSLDGPLEVL